MTNLDQDWLIAAQSVKATGDSFQIEYFDEDAEEACYSGDISYDTLDEIRKILSLIQ